MLRFNAVMFAGLFHIHRCFRFFSTIAFLFSASFSVAQRVFNFSVTQSVSAVAYSFTYRSGSTCNGYQLMYSTDSLNFIAVDNYPGICGASGADEFFSGVHKTPKVNAWNYYRIQMANFESSEIRKVFVSSDGNLKAVVFPNPYTDNNLTLHYRISGANNLRLQGFVYDANGYAQQYIDTTTTADTGVIDTRLLENGLYIVWLTDGTNLYKGKFLVMQ